jgi:methylenetetrahydrofolate reductase (NADPH)
MKIIDLLTKENFTLSFEVFPPKTESNFNTVKRATEEIARLSPAFMSVTYGAGGGTSKYTLEIAKNILKEHGVPTLAHLTCVSSTKETVKERILEIKNSGIEKRLSSRSFSLFAFSSAEIADTLTLIIFLSIFFFSSIFL